MNVGLILLILLVILLVGGYPVGIYHGGFGPYFGGGIGTVVVIVLVLLFLGRL